MEPNKLSKTLIRRLPLYLEYLKGLDPQTSHVSATVMAQGLGMGEVQVRKDLAKIAGEGRRRTGRCRDQLIRDITWAMTRSTEAASVLVGAKGMGRALLDSGTLSAAGLEVLACFDPDQRRSCVEEGIDVYSMSRLETFCKYYNVVVGIIAVPEEQAQWVCDGLIACGIRDIWNNSPAELTVPQGVQLINI